MANGESFGIPQVDPLLRLFRPNCTDCGSRRLVWAKVVDFVFDRLGQIPPAEMENLLHMREHFGDTADAWECLDCGEYGILGGFETGTA